VKPISGEAAPQPQDYRNLRHFCKAPPKMGEGEPNARIAPLPGRAQRAPAPVAAQKRAIDPQRVRRDGRGALWARPRRSRSAEFQLAQRAAGRTEVSGGFAREVD
jgi:hypothetical protein